MADSETWMGYTLVHGDLTLRMRSRDEMQSGKKRIVRNSSPRFLLETYASHSLSFMTFWAPRSIRGRWLKDAGTWTVSLEMLIC